MNARLQPLQEAIDLDGFQYMETYMPHYFAAITASLNSGASVDEIKRMVLTNVGPDRLALARRVEQCANHMRRSRSAELQKAG